MQSKFINIINKVGAKPRYMKLLIITFLVLFIIGVILKAQGPPENPSIILAICGVIAITYLIIFIVRLIYVNRLK